MANSLDDDRKACDLNLPSGMVIGKDRHRCIPHLSVIEKRVMLLLQREQGGRRFRESRKFRPQNRRRLKRSLLHESLETRRVLAATVNVSIAPPSEVDEGLTSELVYTLTRDETDQPLSVPFQLSGDAGFGVDYTVNEMTSDTVFLPQDAPVSGPVVGTAIFLAGESTVSLSVRPTSDGIDEPDEDVVLTLLDADDFGTVFGAASLAQSGEETEYYVVDDQNRLGRVDVTTGRVEVLGEIDSTQTVQDLAVLDDGTLFAISADNLYELDPDNVVSGTVATRFMGAHNIISANALVAARDGDFNSSQGDLIAVGTAALDLQGIDLELIAGQWEIVNVVTLFDVDGELAAQGFQSNYVSGGDLDYLSGDSLVLSASGFDQFSSPEPFDTLIEIQTPGTGATIDVAPVPAQDPGEDFDDLFALAFDAGDSFAFSGHTLLRINSFTLDASRELELTGTAYSLGTNVSATGTILGTATGTFSDTIGLYQPSNSLFHLKEDLMPGVADIYASFGPSGSVGWVPLSGDWDGDGIDTIGLYQPDSSLFHLTDSFASVSSDHLFAFGPAGAGWVPVAGDWNGDGIDTVGLYQPDASLFHLKNTFSGGAADIYATFGVVAAGNVPLAGDWNNDGIDTVGLYQPLSGTFQLKNSFAAGPPDLQFVFGPAGNAGWTPIVGDWNADGVDTVGLYQPSNSLFHLKDTFSGGLADHYVTFGPAGDAGWIPLAGDWNGESVAATAPVDLLAATPTPGESADEEELIARRADAALRQW